MQRYGRLATLLLALVFSIRSTDSLAAGQELHASEVLLLAQIVVLIVVGRVLGEAMQRIGQPGVMGQLIGGIVLGPSVLGIIWPEGQKTLFPDSPQQKAMLDAVGQIGILMLLLLAGMETDLSLVRKVRRAAASASAAGIAIPFVCGFALGELLPDSFLPQPHQRLAASLFLGTALSISSVKIVAVVVREMDFLRRKVGQIILASAIIDDTIGWIIIAITFSIASKGAVDIPSVAMSVAGTALFLTFSFTVGRRLVFAIIRWTNDNFVSELPVIAAVLVIMGSMALATDLIGVHTVLGAFVAGILVGESPILTRQIDDQLRGFTSALFMPVFFGLAGLNSDLSILQHTSTLGLTVGLIIIASIGKFGGAFAGAYLGGLSMREALALGCGMNARGSTEVIVASIGLSIGVLNRDLFTMIVAMAVITTLAMPPTLRWALSRLPPDKEEEERLEQERFEERGFVPNLERLLLAADGSPSGKLAARVAALLAGAQGMPLTILKLDWKRTDAAKEPRTGDATATIVKKSAEKGSSLRGDDAEDKREISITTREGTGDHEAAVAAEARKGYDLLVIGTDAAAEDAKGIGSGVSSIARGFDGPLALIFARGVHKTDPIRARLNIIVPVTGSDHSRRGAEVAIALASATRSPLTAVYVGSRAARAKTRRLAAPTPNEEAVLKNLTKLGEQLGVSIRTQVRVNLAAEDAILRETRRGPYTLVVMGVSRRAGDDLSFGETADAILETSNRSVLVVSSGS